MEFLINTVIAKGAGSTLFGGKQMRGPIRTANFVYEIMIAVALEMTDRLPMFFEDCRQNYMKRKKWNETFTKKGLYTDSYGWSNNREFKHEIDIDPVFFNYFNRIICPFLGGKKKAYNDENSRIWKVIKKIIIEGDKIKIDKLQQNIRRQIMKEAEKKFTQVGGHIGPDTSDTCGTQAIQTSGI